MQRKYIQVNDIHISDQAPRGRTPSYLDDILAKLAWCVDRANDLEVHAIVITGDLFHRKNATHTSHRTVQRVRSILERADAQVMIVPGNHDEANGGGLAGQPLLSVVDGVRIVLLDGPSELDAWVGGVPWDNAFEREGGVEVFAERVADLRTPLVFAHAPISDKPFPFGPEAQGWLLDSDVVAECVRRGAKARLIAHGHMHGQQPIGGDTIVLSNPGALSRATVAVDDVNRAPSIAIITVESPAFDGFPLEVEYEEVPHRPVAEVMRLEEHERDHDRDDAVQRLASSLVRAYAEVVDRDAILDMLRVLGKPEQFTEEEWARGIAMAVAAVDEVPA